MKSKLVLPLVGIASVAVILAVFLFRPIPTTLTHENFARLKNGMTYDDVVKILGTERLEVEDVELLNVVSTKSVILPSITKGLRTNVWIGEHVTIVIDFDEDQVINLDLEETKFRSKSGYLWWRARRSIGMQ